MSEQAFKAFWIEEKDDAYVRSLTERDISELPDNELLVRVHYSGLNYKDALSATGNKGVTRNYPHTPGVDAAGTVVDDSSGRFNAGDEVIVTSYDLGMNTDGGFAEYIRVPSAWAVPLPEKLDMKDSMILGTAGLTAAQSVYALARDVAPEDGDILVTGATGGVGSLAVAMLAKLGYSVTAITGKKSAADYLKSLGASTIIDRTSFLEGSDRPMLKTQWAGVIDTVGGDILATAIKSTSPQGIVTCCGMVASPDLHLTVFPFILRGVTLVGIDSQNCPMPLRTELWGKLAEAWKPAQLSEISTCIDLSQLDAEIEKILSGQHTGRTVIDLHA
ncbi:MAG: YhdH/YhfP family quinone oxidoreductase [Gammaproteobacteria bacterium]|nr:YhdH/YhfP family quinone oxidoreductase [Gammaproteobacteria bacterium]